MSEIVPISQAEQKKNEIIQMVTFALEREEYGVEVLSVREIIRMPELTKMPNAPHYVEGVINLRGTVIPVISLRKRFNLDDHDHDRNSRILVMELRGGNLTGFIVDSVAEVIRIQKSSIQPAPDVAHQDGMQDCITGILDHNNRLLILLDLNLLFADEEHEELLAVM
ncbi:scaffold protein CheW associated with MCPs of classes 40H and 40+24H [Geotalea daltonii FRC-32]|uniref:Scaffold protein CheW associated with MCPs of classes 40H and 40+24H n=1 Tax=Geotalea daltonii (strain DSM 22248 / JCM 15807 / FRC-32) TaxID=316067 RepID=B9M458_GEODF|nr:MULTISPECIES: chemotaxis protein CheW [Geotalea]ACM21513.1 scaffold protein CheW associated with MCPs of classes 40H and 40+24H [Geotalea daltonii FRC-32]